MTMQERKALRSVLLVLAAAAAALVLPSLVLLALQLEYLYNVYVNLYTALAALAATYLCFLATHRLGGSPPHVVRPWMLATLGLGLWAVAEVIWLCYTVTAGVPSEITVSDFLWLTGYAPLAAGLWGLSYPFLGKLRRLGYTRGQKGVLAALVIALTLLVLAALEKMFTFGVERPHIFTLNVLYVLLDILMLAVSLAAVTAFSGGLLEVSLRFVAGGFILFATSDLLYAVAETYEFVPADIMYAFSYLLIAAGLWVYLRYMVPSSRS